MASINRAACHGIKCLLAWAQHQTVAVADVKSPISKPIVTNTLAHEISQLETRSLCKTRNYVHTTCHSTTFMNHRAAHQINTPRHTHTLTYTVLLAGTCGVDGRQPQNSQRHNSNRLCVPLFSSSASSSPLYCINWAEENGRTAKGKGWHGMPHKTHNVDRFAIQLLLLLPSMN